MSTELRPNTGPGSVEYVPGEPTKAGVFCVQAGDRLTFTGWSFKNFVETKSDVVPDAEGYMPHFSIRPRYVRDAGLGSSAVAAMRREFGIPTSGNIEKFPFVRVDLGSVWFPYAAEVKIDGGNGPGAEFGTLLITYEWERQGWHTNPTTGLFELAALFALKTAPEHIVNLFNSLFGDSAIAGIEKRDAKNTLTFYNSKENVRIERPTNSIDVFTPDNVDLILNNGPGTYSSMTRTGSAPSGGGVPVPLGPFGFITPVANTTTITFTVQL